MKTKEFKIKDIDGVERTYILSRMPYWDAREILTQYPVTAAPKIGSYKSNEELAQKLFNFVSVNLNGAITPLTTKDYVSNHVPDAETGLKVEWAMIEYNCGFLQRGGNLGFLESITRTMKALVTSILTTSQEQSSAKEKQPSTN